MGKTRERLVALTIAMVGAIIPAVFVIGMLADNNNQGELFDPTTGKWDVAYVLKVSALISVPSFLVIFAAVLGAIRFRRLD